MAMRRSKRQRTLSTRAQEALPSPVRDVRAAHVRTPGRGLGSTGRASAQEALAGKLLEARRYKML